MFSIIAQPNQKNTQVNFDGSDFVVTATTEGWSVSNCPWVEETEVFPFTEDSLLIFACQAATMEMELATAEQVKAAIIELRDGKKTFTCESMYSRTASAMVNYYLPRIPQALRAIEGMAKKEWSCELNGEKYILSCEGVDSCVEIQLESTPIGVLVKVDALGVADPMRERRVFEDGDKYALIEWLSTWAGGMIAAIAGTPVRGSEMKRILSSIDVPTEFI